MTDTRQFSEQHEDLMDVAQQLAASLDAETLARDAWETRGLLSKLAGKLTVHLALEDNILYSVLLDNADDNVRTVSQQFIDEMGGIVSAFQTYLDNWPYAMAIEERPQEFIDETQAILVMLAERIEKEEKFLYPLAQNNGDQLKAMRSGTSTSTHAA